MVARTSASEVYGSALECGPPADGLPLFCLGRTSLLVGVTPHAEITASKLATNKAAASRRTPNAGPP